MKKAFFNWSGGKDSSLALYHILQQKEFSIEYLLTNLSAEHQRISMHGVSFDLLKQQAESLGFPLETMSIIKDATMEDYGKQVTEKMSFFTKQNINNCVFGDIFLEDLKVYRENQLKPVGITAHFPLWQRPTIDIINEFIDLGFKAKVVSINAQLLDKSFAGRELDKSFINDLPDNVDVCGENGEFHSFVYDGPIFKNPIPIEVGDIVKKEYKSDENSEWDNAFWYVDLIEPKKP
jgi:uncharacterized protein (TIGR00290 family)